MASDTGERHVCPRRVEDDRGAASATDSWRDDYFSDFQWSWMPRVCSYCGSLHPGDALRLLSEAWEIEISTKAYKAYMHPPGYAQSVTSALRKMRQGVDPVKAIEQRPSVNEPRPPAKVYMHHFSADQIAELNRAPRYPIG